MKEKNDFLPLTIATDRNRVNEAIKDIDRLCKAAAEFCINLNCFFDETRDKYQLFAEYGDLTTEKNDFIVSLFEVRNPDLALKFDIRKMQAAGMIDTPPELLESREDYFKAKNAARLHDIKFRLLDLKHETEIFALTEDLIEQIKERFTVRTKTSDENEILESILIIQKSVNDLIETGFLKSNLGAEGVMLKLKALFNYNLSTPDRPMEIKPQAIKRLLAQKSGEII